jgi:hypothetical protein
MDPEHCKAVRVRPSAPALCSQESLVVILAVVREMSSLCVGRSAVDRLLADVSGLHPAQLLRQNSGKREGVVQYFPRSPWLIMRMSNRVRELIP